MKEVKEYYDNYNYPLIKLYTNRQTKKHYKLLKKILSFAKVTPQQLAGKKVLDAGCGTGEKSVFFAKNGAKVTSIDISSGQLSVLRKRVQKEGLDIRIFQKDILNDDLKSLGSFDYIFSIGVLHHTENAKKGFENLSLLLKPGGIIVIALYHKYARLRYRITRLFLHTFFSKDPKKLEGYFKSSIFLKPLKKAPKNSINDRYLVPFESYHTVCQVKKWFLKQNIRLLTFSPEFRGFEIFKVFEKKTLFFISGIFKNKIK